MNHKIKDSKIDIFSTISIIAALLVIFLMGSALLAIIVRGAPDFVHALKSEEVRFAIRLSSVTATASTILCMIFAIPASYALTRTAMPFKGPASILLELTLSMPFLLLGLSLLIIFSSDFGKGLRDIGFAVVFSPLGIVMAQLVINLPFCIRMIRTAFSEVDERLEHIAQLLGASKFKSFMTVTLPLCRRLLITTFILTWSRALGEFGATLMLVGITRMKTETLPGCIYLNISTGNNGMAMATAMIVLLISTAALTLSNLFGLKKVHYRWGENT